MNPNVNSDLIPAGAGTNHQAVAAIATHDKAVAPMAATPVKEYKYYHLAVSAAKMLRTDGKNIPFVHNICKALVEEDILYLDKEIKSGNIYLRLATPDEVHEYEMRLNPKQTMKDQLRPEIEAEIRDKLETEIRAKVEAEHKIGIVAATTSAPQGDDKGFRASIVSSAGISHGAASGEGTPTARAAALAALGSKK